MPARRTESVTPLPESGPQATQVAERNLLQDDLAIKAELEAQPKKTIYIAQVGDASSDDPMPDVIVGINGYNYQIRRGEYVDVPESVAEVLMQSMEASFTDNKGNRRPARSDLTVMVR